MRQIIVQLAKTIVQDRIEESDKNECMKTVVLLTPGKEYGSSGEAQLHTGPVRVWDTP